MLKTVTLNDIESVMAGELEAGMITYQGIIVTGGKCPSGGHVHFLVTGKLSEPVTLRLIDSVEILGRIDPQYLGYLQADIAARADIARTFYDLVADIHGEGN